MPKPKKSPRQKSPTPVAKSVTRRNVLGTIAIYGTGAAVLGGAGTAFGLDFRNKLAEADLTRIGQGNPTIVQIHDPSCQLCQDLQRQTRSALANCDENYTYLVANITTQQGAAFAARMGQPHVTLVLLDGRGDPLHVINGVTPAATIKAQFQTYFG